MTKKGFFGKLFDKLDKNMKKKADESCCSCNSTNCCEVEKKEDKEE